MKKITLALSLNLLFAQPVDIFEPAHNKIAPTQAINTPKQNNLSAISASSATLIPSQNLQTQQTPQTIQTTQPIAKAKKRSIKEATMSVLNRLRTQPQVCSNPTTPLHWNNTLYTYAKEHAIDMAVNNRLSHQGSGTQTDKTAQRLGLKRGSYFYERVNQAKDSRKILSGELVLSVNAHSMKLPRDVLYYWISNPKDCKVIMDSRFTDVALSKVINDKTNKAYWVLLLAGAK